MHGRKIRTAVKQEETPKDMDLFSLTTRALTLKKKPGFEARLVVEMDIDADGPKVGIEVKDRFLVDDTDEEKLLRNAGGVGPFYIYKTALKMVWLNSRSSPIEFFRVQDYIEDLERECKAQEARAAKIKAAWDKLESTLTAEERDLLGIRKPFDI